MTGQRWRIDRATVAAETEQWQLSTDVGEELSFRQVMSLWKDDEAFRAFWNECLRAVPFDAYCWECPPVTTQNSARAFECVFVSSPLLAEAPPDAEAFAEHFREGCKVVTFESLGKDALLVAPCPGGQGANFAHLARFVASASKEQSAAFWQCVGESMVDRLGARPTWLSTAGLGISWLHVRLDTRPKYYRHAPYRASEASYR